VEAGRRLAGHAIRDMLRAGQGASPVPEILAVSRPRSAVYAGRG